jgi:hypothetical protein
MVRGARTVAFDKGQKLEAPEPDDQGTGVLKLWLSTTGRRRDPYLRTILKTVVEWD